MIEVKIGNINTLHKGDIFMTKSALQLVSPMYYRFIRTSDESVEVYSLDSNFKINSVRCWIVISAFETRAKYGELFILKENEE